MGDWRWLVLFVILGCLLRPGTVDAAAPRLIVVEGDLLPSPVRLTDWRENLDLLLATEVPGRTQTPEANRPRLDLLYFYLPEGAPLSSADSAPPQARVPYWPAVPGHPAVIGSHVPDQRALDILARHGVPTVVDWSAPTTDGAPEAVARAVALAVAALIAAWLAVIAVRLARPAEA